MSNNNGVTVRRPIKVSNPSIESLPLTGSAANPFEEFKGSRFKIKIRELAEKLEKQYDKPFNFFHTPLTVNKEGKKTILHLTVQDDAGTEVSEKIELVLEERNIITGRVVNFYNHNAPVRGAHVWVKHSENPNGKPEDYKEDNKIVQDTSNENGEFILHGHFRQSVIVCAELEGIQGRHTAISGKAPIDFTIRSEPVDNILIPLMLRPKKHDLAADIPRHIVGDLQDSLEKIGTVMPEIKNHSSEIIDAVEDDIKKQIQEINSTRRAVIIDIAKASKKGGEISLSKQEAYVQVLKERRTIKPFGVEIVTSDLPHNIFFGELSPDITNAIAAKSGFYGEKLAETDEVVLGPLNRVVLSGAAPVRVFTQALPLDKVVGYEDKNRYIISGFGTKRVAEINISPNIIPFKRLAEVAEQKDKLIERYSEELKRAEDKLEGYYEAESFDEQGFTKIEKTALINGAGRLQSIRHFIEDERICPKLKDYRNSFQKIININNPKVIFPRATVDTATAELEKNLNSISSLPSDWDTQKKAIAKAFDIFFERIEQELIEGMLRELNSLKKRIEYEYAVLQKDIAEYNRLFEEENRRIERESQRLAA